jgi:hypothetical protein
LKDVDSRALGESGTLLIFQVKGQCHQVKFLPQHPCEHSRINILQCILTKLGTYLVLKRIWNPIYFQGQRERSPTHYEQISKNPINIKMAGLQRSSISNSKLMI